MQRSMDATRIRLGKTGVTFKPAEFAGVVFDPSDDGIFHHQLRNNGFIRYALAHYDTSMQFGELETRPSPWIVFDDNDDGAKASDGCAIAKSAAQALSDAFDDVFEEIEGAIGEPDCEKDGCDSEGSECMLSPDFVAELIKYGAIEPTPTPTPKGDSEHFADTKTTISEPLPAPYQRSGAMTLECGARPTEICATPPTMMDSLSDKSSEDLAGARSVSESRSLAWDTYSPVFNEEDKQHGFGFEARKHSWHRRQPGTETRSIRGPYPYIEKDQRKYEKSAHVFDDSFKEQGRHVGGYKRLDDEKQCDYEDYESGAHGQAEHGSGHRRGRRSHPALRGRNAGRSRKGRRGHR